MRNSDKPGLVAAMPGKPSPSRRRATPLPLPLKLTLRRGEIWAVDFEPQSHREEPGKIGRPALVLQADSLNGALHGSTIVIPGTSQTQLARQRGAALAARVSAPTSVDPEDADALFPLRVRVAADARTGLRQTTDLLIDQVRAVSNRRFIKRLGVVEPETLARTEQALRWLTSA